MAEALYEAKGLREKRAGLINEMKGLLQAAGEDGLDNEGQAKFDRLDAEVGDFGDAPTGLAARIQQIERCHTLDAELGKQADTRARVDFVGNPKTVDDRRVTAQDGDLSFRAWVCHGKRPLTTREQEAVHKTGTDLDSREYTLELYKQAPRDMEHLSRKAEMYLTQRSTGKQSIGDSTLGGRIVATEPIRAIEVALKAFGGMREAATIIRTRTGSSMSFPSLNDSTEVASIKTENAAATEQAMQFGTVSLGSYQYSSGIVGVSRELMQDEDVGLESLIGESLGNRFGRGTNAHFTTGTGSGQPSGAVTTSIVGSTGADVHVLTYAEFVTLLHAVDPAYRMDPSFRWMLSDTTLKATKQILDGENRPIWSGSMQTGDPDTILGKPYIINQDMASIVSTSAGDGALKVILAGAFNRYKIREVRTITMMRLVERYAELGHVAFLGLGRWDGVTVQASTVTAPIFHHITKST